MPFTSGSSGRWVPLRLTLFTSRYKGISLRGFSIPLYSKIIGLPKFMVRKIILPKSYLFHYSRLKHYIEIIYEIALCFEVPITLVFWGFLFQILIRNGASGTLFHYQSRRNHSQHQSPSGPLPLPVSWTLLQQLLFPQKTFLGCRLLRYRLSVYQLRYFFIYNLVYSLSVKVIYEPIDWKSVLSYCIVVGSYFITFGAHHFGGFAYRKWKAHKLMNRIH